MKNLLERFVKTYTVTFVFTILYAVSAVLLFGNGIMHIVGEDTSLWTEITMLCSSVVTGSFMVHKFFDAYPNKTPSQIKANALLTNVASTLIAFVIYGVTRLIFVLYRAGDSTFAGMYLSIILVAFTYYFVLEEKNMELCKYEKDVFMNILVVILVFLIVITGSIVIFYIIIALFKSNNFAIMDMAKIVMVESIFISTIGFCISAEYVGNESGSFEKILIKYIMFTMVLIGFMIFYMYLLRIIIKMQMPSNQVFSVCSILFYVGIPIVLMAKSFDKGSLWDKIIHFLPLAFIPALIIQTMSLVLRIHQYGLTTIRYIGIVLIIFEIVYLVYYIFKYDKIKNVLVVVAIITFVMAYVPFINIAQLPNIYNTVFSYETMPSITPNENIDIVDTGEEVVDALGKR